MKKLLGFLIFWSVLSCDPWQSWVVDSDQDIDTYKSEPVPYGSWRAWNK